MAYAPSDTSVHTYNWTLSGNDPSSPAIFWHRTGQISIRSSGLPLAPFVAVAEYTCTDARDRAKSKAASLLRQS